MTLEMLNTPKMAREQYYFGDEKIVSNGSLGKWTCSHFVGQAATNLRGIHLDNLRKGQLRFFDTINC